MIKNSILWEKKSQIKKIFIRKNEKISKDEKFKSWKESIYEKTFSYEILKKNL